MAPETQIITVISKDDLRDEIQRRLQDAENQKARRLLASVTGHFAATKITLSRIEQQVLQVKYKCKDDKRK